jgi:hypothetical protein
LAQIEHAALCDIVILASALARGARTAGSVRQGPALALKKGEPIMAPASAERATQPNNSGRHGIRREAEMRRALGATAHFGSAVTVATMRRSRAFR